MRTKIVLLAAIVSLMPFVSGCGKKPQVAAETPPVVTGVQLETVAASSVEDFYEATGTVRAKTSTVLSSKIMGTVTGLRVREGDRVNAGQTLIEIDNREAAAQLQKAQAGLRQAEQTVAEAEQASNAAQSAKSAAEANKRLADATLARPDVGFAIWHDGKLVEQWRAATPDQRLAPVLRDEFLDNSVAVDWQAGPLRQVGKYVGQRALFLGHQKLYRVATCVTAEAVIEATLNADL